jgi:hypothetical protein
MANEKIAFDLDAILKKVQLGQQLTQDEEVFYLIKALDMKKEDAKRMVYLGEHQEPGVLRD